jgi:hypothetical protein
MAEKSQGQLMFENLSYSKKNLCFFACFRVFVARLLRYRHLRGTPNGIPLKLFWIDKGFG